MNETQLLMASTSRLMAILSAEVARADSPARMQACLHGSGMLGILMTDAMRRMQLPEPDLEGARLLLRRAEFYVAEVTLGGGLAETLPAVDLEVQHAG
jgi:hypothetical protein